MFTLLLLDRLVCIYLYSPPGVMCHFIVILYNVILNQYFPTDIVWSLMLNSLTTFVLLSTSPFRSINFVLYILMFLCWIHTYFINICIFYIFYIFPQYWIFYNYVMAFFVFNYSLCFKVFYLSYTRFFVSICMDCLSPPFTFSLSVLTSVLTSYFWNKDEYL